MAQAALTVGDQEWKPWFWLGDGEEWQLYSDEDTKLLEEGKASRHDTVLLTHCGTICEATSKKKNRIRM